MDRWAEFKAGTLPANSVIQHDTLYAGTGREEHLIWFYTGTRIYGPFSRSMFDASVEASIASLVASIVTGEAPDTYSIICEDGEVISGDLYRQNDRTPGTNYEIDLTISPTPQQIAAWQLIKPVLGAHLLKVNRVYKRLPENKQTELREHCSIFDAVMKITEDEQ